MSRAEMLALRWRCIIAAAEEAGGEGDPRRANVRWVEERCRIPEEKFVGQTLQMADFMVEDLRAIYDNDVLTPRRSSAAAARTPRAVATG